ncbi:DUF6434 domain-containing protein [Polaribacter porphyrae]|uniref:DUF6434 domain-containing protein n=1 Tax=Polaribacter porphyrae TaxID=1137780 RepID=A0A2S7WPR8_9FLAO|nr:DUF6434 domain-containing protein [Polaribacter porphyrae]PQJ79573.1 hypothetical protein BTO18_10495 [Polaribacter porphyrae]
MDKRPTLNKDISVKDFTDFYWLKKELMQFCKKEDLRITGSKIDISKRIAEYLNTGKKNELIKSTENKKTSTFNWKTENLTLKTLITDNYKSTENVRSFFEKEIGKQFKFNIKFMNWMKVNSGKNLKDAIEEWNKITIQNKLSSAVKNIAPQFEYNTYLRDFLLDNPKLKRNLGIQLWNLKKQLRGNNKYEKEDLNLIKDD